MIVADRHRPQIFVNQGATAEELSTISVGIWILFTISMGFLVYWGQVTWNAWANSVTSKWIPVGLFVFAILCGLIFFIEGLLLRNYVLRITIFENGLASFELAKGKRIEIKLYEISSLTFIVYTIRENELAGQRCLVLWPHLICVPETVEDFQSVRRRIQGGKQPKGSA